MWKRVNKTLSKSQKFKLQCSTFDFHFQFDGLKRNAMTNMSGYMAKTSVTDFFTSPKLGQVSGSINVWTRPCLKSGRVLNDGPGGNWRLCKGRGNAVESVCVSVCVRVFASKHDNSVSCGWTSTKFSAWTASGTRKRLLKTGSDPCRKNPDPRYGLLQITESR